MPARLVATAKPPPTRDLAALGRAAASCTACPLYANATQTVWGAGPADADVLLVGEQPGDEEDRTGLPFVGPAGRLLDRALADVGIARDRCWVTNAVKHFKWTPRGKRRIHEKPNGREVAACRPWLESEIASIRPGVLVCLGATATAAVLGPKARVTRDRGTVVRTPFAERTVVTIHPSAILRAPDDETRHREYARFVEDLRAALGPALRLASKTDRPGTKPSPPRDRSAHSGAPQRPREHAREHRR